MDFEISLKDIQYFLYMEDQERKEKQVKVNDVLEHDFVGELTTTNDDPDEENSFS